MKYYGVTFNSQGSLAHFGIKGQKWGIRRYQYDNGSYTPEGKERYGRGSKDKTALKPDGRTAGLFNLFKKDYKPPFKVDQKSIEKDFDESINQHQDNFNRLTENEKKIMDQSDSLSESYKNYYKNLKFTKKEKENIWNGLMDDFGKDGPEDAEIYELAVNDRVYEEIEYNKPKPKALKEERQAFEDALDQYWKDVHAISEPVRQKYKDKYVKDLEKQKSWDPVDIEMNKLIGNKLGTSFISYISRHFDDYWVNNTDEYNEAELRLQKEFPFDEYQRRLKEKVW